MPAPLTALLKASLAAGVDHNRLARGLRDRQYVDWRPLLDLPDGKALVRRAPTTRGVQRLLVCPPLRRSWQRGLWALTTQELRGPKMPLPWNRHPCCCSAGAWVCRD